MFQIEFTYTADAQKEAIFKNKGDAGLSKQVKKALGYLSTNPKHPSLHSHPFTSLTNPKDPGEPIFESYAQNDTPSAYRIFWFYGSTIKTPGRVITVIAITPHP